MIDYTSIRRIIETFLSDNFTLCPVQRENTQIDLDGASEWIAVYDKATFSESAGFQEDAYHLGGVLTIQIYTQLNTGTAKAREIATALSELFNSTDITGVMMQTPELYPGPDNKHWYRHHLIIRYTTVMGQDSSC